MKKKSTHASVRYGVVALCAALLLRCGPLPTKPSSGIFAFQLGLEDGTRTAATFSGEPIAATITLPDSVEFDSIAWHCGSGQMTHPGIAPSLRSKKFNVQLFWTSNPLYKDTATKRLFDTVYVSTHGETMRSNTVKVTVTNVSPVIDSVRIGSTIVKSVDTLNYMISVNDTSTSVMLRVGASDVNLDVLRYDWFSTRGLTLSPAAMVSYGIPKYQFVDTIVVTVSDGKGGSANKMIILSKRAPDHPPIIDSIIVGARMFSQDTAMLVYSARYLDTVKLRVFARDTDPGDSISVTWKKKNAKDTIVRTGPALATLICDTIYRKAINSMRAIDTVTVVVKDRWGDSTRTVIRVVYGFINNPPKLDSIGVDGVTQCKGATIISRDTAVASERDTFLLRVFFSDPDSADTVKLSVKAKQPSQVTRLSDTTVQYVCKDSVYTDTVVCIVKDLAGDSAVKRVVVSVIDRAPSLDSIRVNGVIQCKGAVLIAVDSGSGKDTFVLRVFASDPDKGDTAKMSVKAKKPSQVTMLSDTTVQYACRDSIYTDTVAFMVKDLSGDSAKKNVVIAVVNRLPRIDSIMVQDTVKHRTLSYASSDSLVIGYDSIATTDSVKVSLFAHDPDSPRDSIAQVKWTLSSGMSMKLLDKKGLVVQYPGQSAAGDDTVTVMVADIKQKTYVKSLIFGTR